MYAVYYQIIRNSDGSCELEGILRNSEDTIYPGQQIYQEENELPLPGECECHHFNHPDYTCNSWEIKISSAQARQMRVS